MIQSPFARFTMATCFLVLVVTSLGSCCTSLKGVCSARVESHDVYVWIMNIVYPPTHVNSLDYTGISKTMHKLPHS